MNVKQIMYLLYWKTVISKRDVLVVQNGSSDFAANKVYLALDNTGFDNPTRHYCFFQF